MAYTNTAGHKQERLLSNKALLKNIKSQRPSTVFSQFFFFGWLCGLIYLIVILKITKKNNDKNTIRNEKIEMGFSAGNLYNQMEKVKGH